MHFIGLPSTFEHPKDVDEYGIPHGWCAYCWCSYERDKFNNELSVIKQHRQGTCPTLDKGLFHKTLGDDFHIDYETRVKIWNFISTRKPSVDEKEPCHFCDNTGCSACDSSLVKP